MLFSFKLKPIIVTMCAATALAFSIGGADAQSSGETMPPQTPLQMPLQIPETITPEMRAAFDAARPYCEADAAAFCRWIIPGGGRIVQCMFNNAEKLSASCTEKLSTLVQMQ